MGSYDREGDESTGRPQESGDWYFQLGVTFASGRSVPTDLVAAHKWFNLAAICGNKEAALHRHEIAAEMSANEIAAAQRAARDWHVTH